MYQYKREFIAKDITDSSLVLPIVHTNNRLSHLINLLNDDLTTDLIPPGEIVAILLVVTPRLVGEREAILVVVTPGFE
jgi:hypothetical protein